MEFLVVGHYLAVLCFEVENGGCFVNFLRVLLSHLADSALDLNVLLIVSDDEVVDDHAGVVGVDVACTWSSVEVSFHAVAAVEELADVSSDVMSQHELATWMVLDERSDVQDETIQDHKLLSFLDSLVEFGLCD